MTERLSGKSVIVTGGTRGIGRAIARILAAHDGRVLIVGLNEEHGIRTSADIVAEGGTAQFFRADVKDLNSMKQMAAYAADCFGTVDILCSNAGIFPSALIEEMTEQQWDEVLAVNLKGTYFAVQSCLPYMKRQKHGRIVLTSSITGPVTGYPGWAHYGATKAGMLGFMRSAALELARSGITVNAVLPGNIRTEGLSDVGEDYIRTMEQSIPLGKLGDPEDVAYAALFLASEEAKYITGQTLVVDGGQILPESLMGLG